MAWASAAFWRGVFRLGCSASDSSMEESKGGAGIVRIPDKKRDGGLFSVYLPVALKLEGMPWADD